MMKPYQKYWIIGVLILCTSFSFTSQQLQAQSAAQVQEAKAKLGTMSPDEIKAAVAKYGMTMDEAQAKASAVGIDLESYLKSRAAAPAPAPTTQVNVQVAPAPATPPVTQGQTTAAGTVIVQPKQAAAADTGIIQTNLPGPAAQPPVQAPTVQSTEPAKPPQEAPPVTGPGGLEYFGYNLFKKGGTTFEIEPNLTDNSYIIGIGDILRISLWGDVQSSNDYTVDIQGRIIILPAGPVMIAGYTLEQAKTRIIQSLSRSLAGLVANPPTTSLDVSISQLRPVRAFMMGEVANPGTYSLNSFTTVFNSLFIVGGVRKNGSLRNIRLMRNGKLETEVDLYDYLIGSEKTKDVRINNNDIVYVPLRGRTVGIKGAVLRDAYFELKPKEQLQKLLEFSGGIKSTFYLQRVQINRILPFSERKPGEPERKIFDIDFSQILEKGKDYNLEDGDIVTIYSINDEEENYVDIDGAVWRPGRFQLEKVPTLNALLVAADSLLPEAFMEHATIVRTYDDKTTEVFHVNLDSILNKTSNFVLESWDKVHIFSRYEMLANEDSISIEGRVKNPGRYPLHEGLSLYDVVYETVGLTDTLYRPSVYLPRANLIRFNNDRRSTRICPFNLWELFSSRKGDTLLLPGDRIVVFGTNEMLAAPGSVSLEGMAKKPGTYSLQTNLTLYDLVRDAVGLTDTLFRKQIYLVRADLVRLNEDRYTSRIIPFNLWDLFQSRTNDTLLLPGDRIIIYPINAVQFTDRYIDIFGSVKNPGRYKLSENMSVLDLLIQAGGYTEDAMPQQAEISRLERNGIGRDSLTRVMHAPIPDYFDTSNITSEKMAELRASSFKLQHRDQVFIRSNPNYIFQQSVTISGEVNHPGTYVLSKLDEHLSDIIKRAGGIKKGGYAEGGRVERGGTRMRINVRNAIEDPAGDDDIMMQPNDNVTIPKQPFAVTVNGEVNNPGLFSYVDGKSTSFYINGSGGVTDSADFILVTFPTGISKQVGTHWWSANPSIPDGSSIFVAKEKPEPPEIVPKDKQTTTYDFVKDILAITVSAVTVIVLAAKL